MAEWKSAPAPAAGSVATAQAPTRTSRPNAAFPRVHLLPPQIAEEARVRRAKP